MGKSLEGKSVSHTPGPWVKCYAKYAGINSSISIKHKSPDVDGGVFCEINTLHSTPEAIATMEANAALIASAPDMKRCLEQLLEHCTPVAGQEAVIEYALEVLKKTEAHS